MNNVYLDRQSTDYLAVRSNITPDKAYDNALNALWQTLASGEPIDPDAVHLVIDHHNDSPDAAAALKTMLTLWPHQLGSYLDVMKGPMTEALAPLLLNPLFVEDINARDLNLFKALRNNQTRGISPPADALLLLAQSTQRFDMNGNGQIDATDPDGKTAAATFAEAHLSRAAELNQPFDPSVAQAYLAFDRTRLLAYLGWATLQFPKHQQLMDLYLDLQPNDGTSQPLPMAELALDESFFAFLNVAQEPVKGWASVAVKRLQNAQIPLNDADKAMLADLRKVTPQAAAWLAYSRLREQIASDARVDLDPSFLDTLGGYSQALMAQLCEQQLAGRYLTNGNELVPYPAATPYNGKQDRIIGTPTRTLEVSLTQPGYETTAGDVLQLYVDGKQPANNTYVLTADDIRAGWARISTAALPDGTYELTTQIKSPGGTLSPMSKSVTALVESQIPKPLNANNIGYEWDDYYVANGLESGVYQVNGIWYGVIKFDKEIDATFDPNIKVILADRGPSGQAVYAPAVAVAVDAKSHELHFQLPNASMFWTTTVPPGVVVTYQVRDRTGNTSSASTRIPNSSATGYRPQLWASGNTPNPDSPPPKPSPLDHNAYEALRKIDAGTAESWYVKFYNRGATEPTPDNGQPRLNLGNFAVEALLTKIQFERGHLMDQQIKSRVERLYQLNQRILKLQECGALLTTIRGSTASTDTTKKMKDIVEGKDGNPPGDIDPGNRLNALLSELNFKLFDKEPQNGHYNRNVIELGHVQTAEKVLSARLEEIIGQSQQLTQALQNANNKRNEALETLSNSINTRQNSLKNMKI